MQVFIPDKDWKVQSNFKQGKDFKPKSTLRNLKKTKRERRNDRLFRIKTLSWESLSEKEKRSRLVLNTKINPAERSFFSLVQAGRPKLGKKHTGSKYGRMYFQFRIGPYFADFVFKHKRKMVEIDGRYHDAPDQMVKDAARDQYLRDLGWRVMRIKARELFHDRENVAARLALFLGPKPANARKSPAG